MNQNEEHQKAQSVSRKRHVISLILVFIIGVMATLLFVNVFDNRQKTSEIEPVIEESNDIAKDDENTQDSSFLMNELSVIEKQYAILMTTYFEDLDAEVLIEGALEGMANAVDDPYTEYLDEVEATAFEEDISGSFQGIGAEVMKDGEYVRIVSPIANSPAEQAGLQPNDLISSVDGESVADLTINEAVALIRGPIDTEVELTILRGEEEFSIRLTRAEIPVETVFYEVDEVNPSVGYVNIVNFNFPTYEETVVAIEDLQEQGVEKIVFDVRGNPGGLLTSALQLSNIFVPDGDPLMMTEYREDGEPEVFYASDEFGTFKYEGEAVLLVNEGSASASEILAGAMRSVDIPIYGTTTFGKGTVQSVVSIGEDDELKFTSGKWLTAEGNWINETGIEPDQIVELPDYARLFIINPGSTFEAGQASPEINNLKSVLTALEYDVSENDVYDESVINAIEMFQAENDLPITGDIDADAARLLNDSLRSKIEENDTQKEAALEALR